MTTQVTSNINSENIARPVTTSRASSFGQLSLVFSTRLPETHRNLPETFIHVNKTHYPTTQIDLPAIMQQSSPQTLSTVTQQEEVFTVRLMLGWAEECSFGCVAAVQDGTFEEFLAANVFEFFHSFLVAAPKAGDPDCEERLCGAFTVFCRSMLSFWMPQLQQNESITAATIRSVMQQPPKDIVGCPLTLLRDRYVHQPSFVDLGSRHSQPLTRAEAESSGLFTAAEIATFLV
ncbi:hypothetical protein C8J56DRAFT_1133971 [Mycena floridula]|nr:hypothetical protein C8J56DRAFT_1133971 [Mycena floridula]